MIDTEGLLSIQKDDEKYDKRLLLFCLAVSHLVIINVESEINAIMKNFFIFCTETLTYLGETRVKKPTVHFVLNKRQIPNEEYCKTLVKNVCTTLTETKLDNQINLQMENVHVLTTAMNRHPCEILDGACAALVTDMKFVTNVQKMCESIIENSSEIIQQAGDRFCIPINWIEFANRVLQTIKKHPNLIYFRDIFERDQNQKIRDDIKSDFDQYVTQPVARFLIDKEKHESADHIKNSFQIEYERILRILELKLQEHCENNHANENVQERAKKFIQVQLINIFRSWEVSALMAAEQHKISQMINDIENKLRIKALPITHRNSLMNKQSAIEMFEEELRSIFIRIESSFNSENIWKQSIEMVCHLCDVLDTDALPSPDHIFVYLSFLQTLDNSRDQPISMDDALTKICVKFTSEFADICPLAGDSTDTDSPISSDEIKQSHMFLDNDELSRIFFKISATGEVTRQRSRGNARQNQSELFGNNWEAVIQMSKCFKVLSTDIKTILTSTNTDEYSTELTVIQNLLGAVNTIIQALNKELKIFDFCLSKQFSSHLYVYTVVSTTLYYYNRQKKHFLDMIKDARKNQSKLIERVLPWVVLIENEDENVAMRCLDELCQVLCQPIESQINETIDDLINQQMTSLSRYSIIKELDDEVSSASDDWLLRYILQPFHLIIERFNEKWMKIKATADDSTNAFVNFVSMRLREIFEFIRTVNTILAEQGAHSLSFVDSLFQLKDKDCTTHTNDKQFCMAKLFHLYLIDEDIPTEISTRNSSIYTINDRWQTIINKCPKPEKEIQNIFRSLEKVFEMSTISYLGVFLEKILSQQDEIELKVSDRMTSFINKIYRINEDRLNNEVRGCQAQCPCCKRICDFNHHLNMTSPIGQGENRHRCQSGHQIRGMGGVRYEMTNEASTSWCEKIGDNDPIIVGQNIRQTWKDFKNANHDWDFGENLTPSEKFTTRYVSIWEKIGRQLCKYFGNEHGFVTENSPPIVNHFIFVLDHSGSMNERTKSSITSTNPTNLTAWAHLLRAVKAFISMRIRQVSLNDQITIILFANRTERIYNREKLTDIDLDRLNIPMKICGEGTNFSAAFQMVIKTLEEVKNSSRQTVIFMTDGEPQDNHTAELQRLCQYRTST